jgi:hypothetical protein
VLEVAAARVARRLRSSNILEHGNFVGIYIDWPQLAAGCSVETLADKGFRFVFADIESALQQAGSGRRPPFGSRWTTSGSTSYS